MGANKSSLMDSVSVVGPSSLAQHAHSSMDIDGPFEQGISNIASTYHAAMLGGTSSLRTSAADNSSNGSATPIYKDGTLMHPAPLIGQAIITLPHSSSGCDPQSTNTASSQWDAAAAAATSQLSGWDMGSSSRQAAGYTVHHGSSLSQRAGETGTQCKVPCTRGL